MVSKMTRGRHAPYAVSPLLATHPRPLRGFPSVLVASLSAFLQHFSRPALSVTIAHPRVARRKPTCPVGARSKRQFRGARMSGRLWPIGSRSEERRVGKECRSGWSAYHGRKKNGSAVL